MRKAEERSVQLAGIDVKVWSQAIDDVHGQPVVVFSHSYHGCHAIALPYGGASSSWVLVLAPNHRDATCNGGHGHWFEQPQIGFRKSENWNEATFEDRGEDVRHVEEVDLTAVTTTMWDERGLRRHEGSRDRRIADALCAHESNPWTWLSSARPAR
jgi:hypothetical protein